MIQMNHQDWLLPHLEWYNLDLLYLTQAVRLPLGDAAFALESDNFNASYLVSCFRY